MVPEDVLPMDELLQCTRTRLAETVRAQANLLVLLRREMAAEQWQSGLTASQRDAVLRRLGAGETYGDDLRSLRRDLYTILITDPGDTEPGGAR